MSTPYRQIPMPPPYDRAPFPYYDKMRSKQSHASPADYSTRELWLMLALHNK